MTPKLYKLDLSPPARAVLLAAEALGITLEYVDVNFLERQQLKPEYIQMNPQHTVPTLEDEGKVIWDSHAIIIYLISKFAKGDSFYPEDSYTRAVINQRLHFDTGVLFPLIRGTVRNMVRYGVKTIPEQIIEDIVQAYEFLEKFLEGHEWAVGDEITLADFSLLPSVTSLDCIVPIDLNKYPNIINWVERSQQLPYYKANQKGLEDFKNLLKKLMS